MKISERIKNVRNSTGYNQTDFGKLFDYTGQQISNFETEKTVPNERFINILKKEYGENFGLTVESPNQDASTDNNPKNRTLYQRSLDHTLPSDNVPVKITWEEIALIKAIRQLDPAYQKSVYISVIGFLNEIEKEKEIKADKQKQKFIADCISELSGAIAQAK